MFVYIEEMGRNVFSMVYFGRRDLHKAWECCIFRGVLSKEDMHECFYSYIMYIMYHHFLYLSLLLSSVLFHLSCFDIALLTFFPIPIAAVFFVPSIEELTFQLTTTLQHLDTDVVHF
jgi:hypothetical protein